MSGSISGTVYVGGVVGAQWNGSITGCSSSTTVKGTVDVGGVAGQTNGGAILTACYATGNVTSTGSSTGDVHIGGFLGDNYTSVMIVCYWKNNHEQGIGHNNKVSEATKVDGTDVTWQKAIDAMNTALQNAGSGWRYELNGALPTLRKQKTGHCQDECSLKTTNLLHPYDLPRKSTADKIPQLFINIA